MPFDANGEYVNEEEAMSRLTRHMQARNDYIKNGGDPKVVAATDKVAGQIAQENQNNEAAREGR